MLNLALADFAEFFKSNKRLNLSEFKNPFFDENIGDESLKLQAILANRAKINDKWYQKNDQINNAKIIAINVNSVLLQKDGQKIRLKITPKNKKFTIKAYEIKDKK